MKKYNLHKILAIVCFIVLSIALSLTEISGLTVDQLMEVYQSILLYLSNPFVEQLDLIYFSSSAHGIQHFADVKQLFISVGIIGIVSLLISIYFIVFLRKKRQQRKMDIYFKVALLLPIGFLLSIFLAFDRIFVLFHEVFFHNDYWLFDPLKDPIITVLPDTLFMMLFVVAIIVYELIIKLIQIFLSRR